jgi:hypothetical protein
VTENPGRLPEFIEVGIEADDAAAGDGGQLMGQPAIAAADLQDMGCLFIAGQVADEAAGGGRAACPFVIAGMGLAERGQHRHFPVSVKVMTVRMFIPGVRPGEARDIDVTGLIGIWYVHIKAVIPLYAKMKKKDAAGRKEGAIFVPCTVSFFLY